MSLGLALLVIGVLVALLVHWTLGVLLMIVGGVLLVAPVMRS